MTASEEDGAADSLKPAERAMKATERTVGNLQTAFAEASDAGEAGTAEEEYVSGFVDTVAEALVDGMNQPVGLYAGMVADETKYHSKTDLKQRIKDRSEEYRGGDKPTLDEFVENRLESVTVVKTTDHRQGAEYIWDFGTFKVETESGKDGRGHFLFSQFRDLIHESGGKNLAKPAKDRRGGEEWRDFMVEMIDDDEIGQEQYTRGARTKAYEGLSNKLKRLTGYGTPEGALDHTGVWIVRESIETPAWWESLSLSDLTENRDLPATLVSEVRVHESVIEPVLDDAGITRSAFYHELNARNKTVPGTSGASMTVWVNGSEERFWTLLPDAGTPRTYVPDPNAATYSTGSLFSGDATEQSKEQPESTPGPVEADGGADRHDGDGFDSVGDTA